MTPEVDPLGRFVLAPGRAPQGIDRDAVLDRVAATRGLADPALEGADAYRRGPEAAAGRVARLDGFLRAVLPASVLERSSPWVTCSP